LDTWSNFISQSGEDQEKYIEILNKEKKETNLSKKQGQNFDKIDKNIKAILKSKESSLDLVEKYEYELISNLIVSDDDNKKMQSYLIENLSCSFERMVLHGVCQYHSFDSKSVKKCGKVTVIVACTCKPENEEPRLLSSYLRDNFYKTSQRAVKCC